MTIREHIADLLGVPVYDCLDWHTWAEVEADSLDVLDMAYKLESRLGVRFPDKALDECKAVGDLVRVAQKSMEEKECLATSV